MRATTLITTGAAGWIVGQAMNYEAGVSAIHACRDGSPLDAAAMAACMEVVTPGGSAVVTLRVAATLVGLGLVALTAEKLAAHRRQRAAGATMTT